MSAKSPATAAVFAMLAAGCATVADRPPETVPLPYVSNFSDSTPGETVPQGWQNWTLSKFKKPTQYKLVDTSSGRTVVKAQRRRVGVRASCTTSGSIRRPIRCSPGAGRWTS